MKAAAAKPPPLAAKGVAPTKPVDEDSACGAPKMAASGNFVAAKPKPGAATAPAPTDEGDFLNDLLNTDTSAAAAGSSDGFVPDFHCTGCDHQVMRVENHVWKGDVPYMFLRNNYPNVMRLREHLKSQQGCSAYCCQCSSRSGDAAAALEDIGDGLH